MDKGERAKLLDDWFLYHRRVYGDGKVHDLHEAGDWALDVAVLLRSTR